MTENYVITIRVRCDDNVNLRHLTELATLRMEQADSTLEIGDVHIDYDTPDDNRASLSEVEGETDASRNA